MSDRTTILAELYRITNHSEAGLMNHLQNRGLVADEAVALSDVPDADLLSALVKLTKRLPNAKND